MSYKSSSSDSLSSKVIQCARYSRHYVYSPYQRQHQPPPSQVDLDIASYDPPRPLMRELREDWEVMCILGNLPTFDCKTGTVLEWKRCELFYSGLLKLTILYHRPVHEYVNGDTHPVAASGLENHIIQHGLIHPLCAHAKNGFRTGCEMHACRLTSGSVVTWAFKAKHEGCDFICEFCFQLFNERHTYYLASCIAPIPIVPKRDGGYILKPLSESLTTLLCTT